MEEERRSKTAEEALLRLEDKWLAWGNSRVEVWGVYAKEAVLVKDCGIVVPIAIGAPSRPGKDPEWLPVALSRGSIVAEQEHRFYNPYLGDVVSGPRRDYELFDSPLQGYPFAEFRKGELDADEVESILREAEELMEGAARDFGDFVN